MCKINEGGCPICYENDPAECPALELRLLFRDSAGTFIPQFFAETDSWQGTWKGINPEDLATLLGGNTEENEGYWDSWVAVENTAIFTDLTGGTWLLYHNGDLWLFRIS